MQERLINIVAVTYSVNSDGTPRENDVLRWRNGWMHPQIHRDIIHYPPGVQMMDVPMQLDGVGEGVRFGIIDILEELTPAHWNTWRSNS